MLATVAFLSFFVALTFQLQGSISAVRQSDDLLRARSLASYGNDVLYNLLKDKSIEWNGEMPIHFSNDPDDDDYFRGISPDSALAQTLAPEALGGKFYVTLHDVASIP